ncbi:hypothetical protein KEM54_006046 [Ascosphaera aggregata]|nr:hypothetical protein KEM54_006046 [Ascosphaera aggregata]
MSAWLAIYRPSPTTVRFTVSDAPSRKTVTAKAIYLVELILRVLVFLFVISVNMVKAKRNLHVLKKSVSYLPMNDGWLRVTVGTVIHNIAERYNWIIVVTSSAILIHLVMRKGYTGVSQWQSSEWTIVDTDEGIEESILVIRGLGIQTSTSSPTYFRSDSTRFIPTTQIQDIVIHEAFKGFEVRFYLALIVEGESEVVVVFPSLLPHRPILEKVWRGSRVCLYDLKRSAILFAGHALGSSNQCLKVSRGASQRSHRALEVPAVKDLFTVSGHWQHQSEDFNSSGPYH